MFEKILDKFDEKKAAKKSIPRHLIEYVLFLWCASIIIYAARNILPNIILAPFHNISGFDHYRVSEVKSAAGFAVAFLLFQKHMRDKIFYVFNVLTN
jgi:hypothetical protein